MPAHSKLKQIEFERGQSMKVILSDLFARYKTQAAVAKELGITQGTLSLWMLRLNLKTSPVLVETDKESV